MNFFSKLFGKKNPDRTEIPAGTGYPRTSGELITDLADGANLVEGRQTWELAQEKKHDIDYMKKCCAAELKKMKVAGSVAAPYYFERVAILSREAKDYSQEIHYCDTYIRSVEEYYVKRGTEGIADVRKGPRFQAISARLPKARELLAWAEEAT